MFFTGSGLLGLLIVGFITLYLWIDTDVKRNISTAKEVYSGKAEGVLIAYLSDTINTPYDRTRVTIYSFG